MLFIPFRSPTLLHLSLFAASASAIRSEWNAIPICIIVEFLQCFLTLNNVELSVSPVLFCFLTYVDFHVNLRPPGLVNMGSINWYPCIPVLPLSLALYLHFSFAKCLLIVSCVFFVTLASPCMSSYGLYWKSATSYTSSPIMQQCSCRMLKNQREPHHVI